jgi:hypothetical protein
MNRLLWWTGALVVVAVLAVSTTACAPLRTTQGATVALDADVDDGLGGTGIESGDVRAAADEMARALAHELKHGEGEAARVAVLPVVNRTRFRIDPALVQNHLVHDLMTQSRRRFALVAVRRGAETSTVTTNAVLKTELRSLTKDNGAVTSDYVEYWFALEDRDGTILWSGMYETKRASSVDVIYQ